MLRVSEPFSSNSVCVCVWPCVSPVPAHGLETCVMFPKGSVPAGSPSSGEKASWPPQPGRLRPVGGRGAGGCRREDVVGFTPQGSQTWRQASNADPRIKAEPPEGPALPKGVWEPSGVGRRRVPTEAWGARGHIGGAGSPGSFQERTVHAAPGFQGAVDWSMRGRNPN